MASVWAAHNAAGRWVQDPGVYTHVLSFARFADLPSMLRGVSGISRLSVVAHGDSPGVVKVGPDLAATSIGSFGATLRALASLLAPTAKVIFFACIAGRGPEGTALLTLLSRHFPQRRLIAFELWGEYSAGFANTPGQLTACSAPRPDHGCFDTARLGTLSPWGPYAKWVVNGVVVRYPMLEQNGRPGRRCANPACRGHALPSDQCSRWHPACEW